MGEPRRARDPPERRPMWGWAGLGMPPGQGGAGEAGAAAPGSGGGVPCWRVGRCWSGPVILTPLFAGACGLGWVPAAAIRAAAAAEGRVAARRGAGRSPGSPSRGGTAGLGFAASGAPRGGIPTPASSSATSHPPPDRWMEKFVEAGVRKCPPLLGGGCVHANNGTSAMLWHLTYPN